MGADSSACGVLLAESDTGVRRMVKVKVKVKVKAKSKSKSRTRNAKNCCSCVAADLGVFGVAGARGVESIHSINRAQRSACASLGRLQEGRRLCCLSRCSACVSCHAAPFGSGCVWRDCGQDGRCVVQPEERREQGQGARDGPH